MESGGVLPSHDRGASWRTHGARGIRFGEFHALTGQVIEVGRLVEIASEAAQARPSEIIREEKNDVRLICGRELGLQQSYAQEQVEDDRSHVASVFAWTAAIKLLEMRFFEERLRI